MTDTDFTPVRNTIRQQWEDFERAVVAKNAPSVQRKEMKLAFFGGAAAILALQIAMPDVSDDDGVEMLKAWHDECEKFARDYVVNAQ